jgi:PTH1 family peptidyl-tRNA hydrolase
MWLFAGLGNPGDEYARHRHNIGFMAVDRIADAYEFPAFKAKYSGLLSEGKIAGEKVAILKPQTFMNLSGRSVVKAAQFYKIEPAKIFVFHDELDLQPGQVRVKAGGGNAGHNGLESIEEQMGTADFKRVRLGIGHPGNKDRVHGYVLGNFAKTDKDWLEDFLTAIAKHAALLLTKESDFMSKVTLATAKEVDIKKK